MFTLNADLCLDFTAQTKSIWQQKIKKLFVLLSYFKECWINFSCEIDAIVGKLTEKPEAFSINPLLLESFKLKMFCQQICTSPAVSLPIDFHLFFFLFISLSYHLSVHPLNFQFPEQALSSLSSGLPLMIFIILSLFLSFCSSSNS